MSSPSARVGSGSERRSLYDQITAKIIAELEAGRAPWAQPWVTPAANAGVAMPTNVATGRRYSGINVLILWGAVIENGFSSHGFLTFRQALGLGGAVRKGERGVTIVYADRYTPEDDKRDAVRRGQKPRTIPFLKRFTVFNVEQCERLTAELTVGAAPVETDLIEPKVEALIGATGIDFRIGGERAFYAPAEDYVRVPPPQAYFEPINWHRTALHELSHASGHSSRLKRDLSGTFGTKKYAFEELVAEMGAAFTCATLGVVPTVRHADYLGAWLEVLREDNRVIVRAASAASKAADYLLSFLPSERSLAASATDPPLPPSPEPVSNASAPCGGAAPLAAF
jgi:antirestriction protein ArdC